MLTFLNIVYAFSFWGVLLFLFMACYACTWKRSILYFLCLITCLLCCSILHPYSYYSILKSEIIKLEDEIYDLENSIIYAFDQDVQNKSNQLENKLDDMRQQLGIIENKLPLGKTD